MTYQELNQYILHYLTEDKTKKHYAYHFWYR